MTNSSPVVHIRDAGDDERAAIQTLTMLAYEQYATTMPGGMWPMYRGVLLSALATMAPAERIVAERNGALVGSVMLFPAAANAYGSVAGDTAFPELRLLAVAPETRGQGIGRMLVKECAARARRAGASILGLHTSASMPVAKLMYEKMGFERYPADDFLPNGAELVMAFRLRLTDD